MSNPATNFGQVIDPKEREMLQRANGDRSVTVVLPFVPPSANVLRRKYRHWAAYAQLRNGIQKTLAVLIQGKDRMWLMANASIRTKMRVDACLCHQRLFDPDNAVAAMKPILDSLVRLKYLAGDSSDKLELHVSQEKQSTLSTKITIREA